MVATLMKSGKKCICAGPGNPPSIVDETCNLEECAPTLIMSHSLENNTLCIGEKEVFVVDAIFDDFMAAMEATGMVRVLTPEEVDKVVATALVPNEKEISGYSPNKSSWASTLRSSWRQPALPAKAILVPRSSWQKTIIPSCRPNS